MCAHGNFQAKLVLCETQHARFFFLHLTAPEMLKGDVVGPPADIWSVGVLTFIM